MGAAADISRANEQNGFHPARRFKVICERPVVNPKSGGETDGRRASAFHQIHRPRENRVMNKGFFAGSAGCNWWGIFVLFAVLDFGAHQVRPRWCGQ